MARGHAEIQHLQIVHIKRLVQNLWNNGDARRRHAGFYAGVGALGLPHTACATEVIFGNSATSPTTSGEVTEQLLKHGSNDILSGFRRSCDVEHLTEPITRSQCATQVLHEV